MHGSIVGAGTGTGVGAGERLGAAVKLGAALVGGADGTMPPPHEQHCSEAENVWSSKLPHQLGSSRYVSQFW